MVGHGQLSPLLLSQRQSRDKVTSEMWWTQSSSFEDKIFQLLEPPPGQGLSQIEKKEWVVHYNAKVEACLCTFFLDQY